MRINLQCSVEKTRQPEGEIRLAVMAGESIYANVRLRLMANRTYELGLNEEWKSHRILPPDQYLCGVMPQTQVIGVVARYSQLVIYLIQESQK